MTTELTKNRNATRAEPLTRCAHCGSETSATPGVAGCSPFTLKLIGRAQAGVLILDGQFLHVRKKGGVIKSKFITAEGARQAFTYNAIDTGWLPPQIKRWGCLPKGQWAVQFNPPGFYEITLPHKDPRKERPEDAREPEHGQLGDGRSGDLRIKLRMPALVFVGFGTSYWIWALKEKDWSPQAKIYRTPLPNIYEDGRVCWGANEVPEVSEPHLNQAWDLFLRSPYTEAHTENKSRKNRKHVCQTLWHVSQRSKQSTPYPVGDLIPYNITVDQAVTRVLEGRGVPTHL